MMEIEAMTDDEVTSELEQAGKIISLPDFKLVESELHVRAAVLGWTGDPLKQPPRSVLAATRSVLLSRGRAR